MTAPGKPAGGKTPGSRRGRKIAAAVLAALLLAAAVWLSQSGLPGDLLYPPAGPDGGNGDLDPVSVGEASTGEETISGEGPVSGAETVRPEPEKSPETLQVYYFDVGQGDSSLLRHTDSAGQTRNILIDTGEYRYAAGLIETLRSLGVERLDLFIITHPHTDHMGCAARIVQNFEISRIMMPRVTDEMTPTTSAYEALLNAVEKKGLTIVDLNQTTALTGESALLWPFGGSLRMQVLAPRFGANWQSLNNWSAVLRFTFGETSFLFAGDAERDCLDIVREDAGKNSWDLKSTVLKASHHGSNDGNPRKWLQAVSPQVAVISCGAGNDYGHPHREPLERLDELGVTVYRTDEDGTLLAWSDGKTVVWETGLPSVAGRRGPEPRFLRADFRPCCVRSLENPQRIPCGFFLA